MSIINNVITKAGLRVQEKRQLGIKVDYTRIVMGDGYLPDGVTPHDVKAVVNPVVSLGISKLKINNNGTAVVGGVFSNADVDKEFYYRELALMADDPDEGEVVYCYGNAGDYAERIAASGGSTITEKIIDIVTVISPTEKVTAQIIRTSNADEIGFDDSRLQLGAGSIQEAIEILAKNASGKMPVTIISDTEPAEPCEIWLKPMGGMSIAAGIGEGGEGQIVLQPLNITGAHVGDEPPTDTSKLWFKPIN